MILFLLGCPHTATTTSIENPYYQMRSTIRVLDDEPKIVEMDQMEKEINWNISLVANDQRKDGSWMYDVHVQCLEQVVQPNEDMASGEGIWMVFRAFPHGEYLWQSGFEQSFGAPCFGEHLDMLIFLLFPNVPSMSKKEPVYRLTRLKSPFHPGVIEHVIQSRWWIIDHNRKKQFFEVGYRGDWESSGVWWEYNIMSDGDINGVLKLSAEGGIPMQNQLTANRDMCYEKENQTYCQKQEIVYSLIFIQ